jgi:hypothetical protein
MKEKNVKWIKYKEFKVERGEYAHVIIYENVRNDGSNSDNYLVIIRVGNQEMEPIGMSLIGKDVSTTNEIRFIIVGNWEVGLFLELFNPDRQIYAPPSLKEDTENL